MEHHGRQVSLMIVVLMDIIGLLSRIITGQPICRVFLNIQCRVAVVIVVMAIQSVA